MASREIGNDYEAIFMPYYDDEEGVWTLGFDALGKYYSPKPEDAVLVTGANIVEDETSFSIDYFGATITVSGGVVQSAVTFVQVPIPVEGDVQVFLDPECTQYATGEVSEVYVRINTPWSGINSGWEVTGPGSGDDFGAGSPSTEHPDEPYYITLWLNFVSNDQAEPYYAGQVVMASYGLGPVDVTNFTKVFSKP